MSAETDVLEQTETFTVEGLDEAVPCQVEVDEDGPCGAEADWASRTACCGTTWTICDPHREEFLARRALYAEQWFCGACDVFPMPDPTWERL